MSTDFSRRKYPEQTQKNALIYKTNASDDQSIYANCGKRNRNPIHQSISSNEEHAESTAGGARIPYVVGINLVKLPLEPVMDHGEIVVGLVEEIDQLIGRWMVVVVVIGRHFSLSRPLSNWRGF